MGILGYPNMDDNGQDGSFGDYSDIYSNYPEEEFNETVAPSEVANASQVDYSQYVNTNNAYQQQQSQVGVNNSEATKKGSSVFYFLFLLVLCAAAVGTYFYKTKTATNVAEVQTMGDYFYNNTQQQQAQTQDAVAPEQKNESDIATVDVDLGSATDVTNKVNEVAPAQPVANAPVNETTKQEATPSVEVKKQEKQESVKAEKPQFKPGSVEIPVLAGGRLDPFMPYGSQAAMSLDMPKFDVIAPPTKIPEVDPVVDKMLDFRVTGIMFDNVRPSAILVVDGYEQLVHKGDIIMDCKVVNITKTKVVVQYKSNIYEVSAGQSLLPQGVNVNPVSSLSNKFGGAYTQTPKDVIEIN